MPNGVDFVLYCAEPLRRRGCNFRTLDHGGLVSTSFAFLGAPAGGSSGLVSPLLIHPRQRVGCPPPYSPLWGLSGPYGGPVRGLGTGLGPLSGLGIGGQGPGSVLFEPVGLRCLAPHLVGTRWPLGSPGGPKLVEAHHSDSPHHLLARHPTCWMIHKGDSQKADDAAVPVHLWLRAFAWGYGDPSCLAHHQVALGLLGGSAGSLANSKPPSAFGVAGVHGRVMQVCSPVLEEEGGAGVSQVATGQPALAS